LVHPWGACGADGVFAGNRAPRDGRRTGIRVRVWRLLWVVEDFYHYRDDVHEIAMYFLLRPPDDCDLLDGRETIMLYEEGLEFEAKWIPLDLLPDVDLRPSCLIKLLQDIPDTSRHVVFRERP